jgi:hypothetical protein
LGPKDVLLGNVEIPGSLEAIDEKAEEGKKLLTAIELNEIAFTEWLPSIDVSSSSGEICNTKEFGDGNAALAWKS